MQAENILKETSDLVRRDSNIPGLELVLNPARLVESLNGQLDISRIEGIKLDYLRYKPGMNCLVRYELRADGNTIHAYAKAHGLDSVNKISKSTERPVIDSFLGPGRVVLTGQKIIFSTFPNDAKLASLHSLNDEGFRRRLFGRMFGSDSAWQDSTFGQILNYKPERRYVVGLERADGEAALAKFYSRGDYAKAHAISRKMNKSHHDFCPETIGRSKKHSVVAYRWQPGTTLRQLSIDGKLSMSDLVATAESLAEFHASSGQGLSLPGLDGQLERLNALADQLGILLPQLARRAKNLAQRLTRWLSTQRPQRQPIHGDFYDKQAVINNGRASLIDLDAAQLGSPLADLGSYIAHLERWAGNHGISVNDVRTQKETLVGAYEKLSGSTCPDQLDCYIALSLFALIHHPFRNWAQDWPVQTERLLTRVENLCVT